MRAARRQALSLCAALPAFCVGPFAADAGDDVAAEALEYVALRLSALTNVMELARIASRIAHVESVAFLAEQFGWPDEVANWPDDAAASKFVYDVFNLEVRFLAEVRRLRRATVRQHLLDDSEAQRFDLLAGEVEQMIPDSQTLYTSLRDGDFAEAAQFFKETVRSRLDRIERDSYTLATIIQADIARTLRAVRR